MAKLVEILAKELVEWPEGYEYIAQDGKRLEFQIAAYKAATVYVSDEWQTAGNLKYGDYFYPTKCSDPATDHATAIVTREMWQAERDRAVTVQGVSRSGPNQWRDRIRGIDATIEAITAERAELVSKLAGEGFALIVVAAEPVEDMSDWRNWKAGDLVQCMTKEYEYVYEIGRNYGVKEVVGDGAVVFDECAPKSCCTIDDRHMDKFRWHSRPSA